MDAFKGNGTMSGRLIWTLLLAGWGTAMTLITIGLGVTHNRIDKIENNILDIHTKAALRNERLATTEANISGMAIQVATIRDNIREDISEIKDSIREIRDALSGRVRQP